jgi:hypothetical protein
MYRHVASSTTRLTIGTGRAGLTYHLSRKILEHMSSERDIFATLMRRARMNEVTADGYHLERSYLTWLDQLSLTSTFGQEHSSEERPRRPFADRIHDWTFRMNANTNADLSSNILGGLFERVGAVFSVYPQPLAMSMAAFVYGGLHLLAWNAPFHASIYGILWKISGIVTASLLILPLSFLLLILGVHFSTSFRLGKVMVGLCLMGTIFFALLYVFARVYLVFESFLSLAYLPESVLTTPNFSLYFPHIG